METDETWSRRAILAAGGLGLGALLAGCGDGPTGPTGPTESTGLVPTRHLDPSPRWRLAQPSSGAAAGLVVALHGHGGDADMAFALGLGDEVERTRLAVVSVDGGNGYWHDRRDGTDSGAMVREDLLPLALRLAGLPGDAPVVLFGWSMGGYGALRIACDLGPERVRGVVAVSAALWRRAGDTAEGAYDDREDFERNSIFGRTEQLQGIPVRLDCGTSDPFIAANRAIAAELPDVTESFTEGGHDGNYWRAQAPGEMAWAATRLA